MSNIKKAWVVVGMDGNILFDDHGDPQEFKSEAAAIKRAKTHVVNTDNTEAWVFVLTHVVSRSDDATVERVK